MTPTTQQLAELQRILRERLGGRCFFNFMPEVGKWRLVREHQYNRMLYQIGVGDTIETAYGDYLLGSALLGKHWEANRE
jgi:hypothetical protein